MKKKSGFTLIELLVVVAIISLLSSVVLASVREAREKAKATAFRQSIGEFVNALELYKSEKGYYPGEQYGSFSWGHRGSNTSATIPVFPPSGFDLPNDLAPYLKKLPYEASPVINYSSFVYENNAGGLTVRCVGDNKIPPYVIVTIAPKGFEDWPGAERYNGSTWSNYANQKCFSLK